MEELKKGKEWENFINEYKEKEGEIVEYIAKSNIRHVFDEMEANIRSLLEKKADEG